MCGLVAASKAGLIPHAAQYTLSYDNHLGRGTYVAAAAPAFAQHQTIVHHQNYQQHAAPLLVAQPQRVHAVAPAYTTAVYQPAPAPVAVPANHYVDYYVSDN